LKFIHCGDFHLDTAFSGLSDAKRAAIRQAELRRSFLAVIELAKDVDALLIAGDLFDQDCVEPETIRLLCDGFASLGDTKVLIAAGNHDPLTENSYYNLAAFPQQVHVFGTTVSHVTVADCDVYGISFGKAVCDEPLLEVLPKSGGRPSVMLMHGDLGGHAYNPVKREAIMQSGIDYLALGHVHSFMQETVGKTLCAYPGCPEGRGFDELGPKGVICGEITDGGVNIQFVPICSREYCELSVDVSGLGTHEAMLAAIRACGMDEKNLYKVILTGETELVPDTAVLTEGLSDCFFAKIYDKTVRPLDVDAMMAEQGIRSMLAGKLAPGLSGEEAALHRKALEYGLSALEGRRVKAL